VGGDRQGAGYELTQGAVVFLVDARASWRSMRFDVGADGRSRGISRRCGVDDANDAGQNGLGQRRGEDPSTNKSRNATTHSVVSCV
jgi:hypothetical protein